MIEVGNRIETRILELILQQSIRQTELLTCIAADIRRIWDQIDDVPVGFKINATKL